MPEQKVINKTELQKKCLEEIREHCQEEVSKLNWTASDILQKINEVLDNV